MEAQSKIMAFIENKLPDDELREFIKHVRSCKNCYEELDIYYTLIVGMKQLDESDNISTDFKNALDKHLEEEMNRLTTVKRIANSTILVGIAAVVAGLIWLYSLLEIDDSLIAKIFEKMGVNVTGAVNAVEDKLARLPKVSGGNMYAGNNFSKALIQAEKEAKQMGDTYVSVEHLFLGVYSMRSHLPV